MAKKKQTVRVTLEYKVVGGPDGEAKTTARLERDVAGSFASILNAQGYDMPIRVADIEVVD